MKIHRFSARTAPLAVVKVKRTTRLLRAPTASISIPAKLIAWNIGSIKELLPYRAVMMIRADHLEPKDLDFIKRVVMKAGSRPFWIMIPLRADEVTDARILKPSDVKGEISELARVYRDD